MNEEDRKSELIRGQADNGLTVWAKPDQIVGKLSAEEKKVIGELDVVITSKAEIRAPNCWYMGCKRSPRIWVREVRFDLSPQGTALGTIHVSSSDYSGPVPGLCLSHEHTGSELLATAIYNDRPEIQWGYRPERAVVIYTDGSKTEFSAVQLVEPQVIVSHDELIRKDENDSEENNDSPA